MKVAVIGTGLMGTALVEALIAAGHETVVYNRTAAKIAPLVAKGAVVAASPAEAVNAADASILVLLDGAATRDVLLGESVMAAAMGKPILNASTTLAHDIVDMSRKVAERGGRLAEATILVDAEQLRTRRGRFLIGCAAEDEALWTNLLTTVGECARRVGEVGDASKAETPAIYGSLFGVVTVAYAAAVVTKLNLPRDISEEVIKSAVPNSEFHLPNMFSHDYDNIFASVDNFMVVANTAIEYAESVGVPTKILEDIRDLFAASERRGFALKDGASIFEVLLDSSPGA